MANQPANREKATQGTTLDLDVKFRAYQNGSLVDDDNYLVTGQLPVVKIYNPAGTIVSDSSQTGAIQPIRTGIGQYYYPHPVGISDTVSANWKIEWTIVINALNIAFSELFEIVSAGSVTFGEEEFRVGFAFNNPDLTSPHHTTLWDNESQTVKGWGLLLAPDELRYIMSFGQRLVSPDANQTFDDNMLMYYIDNAIAMLERDLCIDILPRVIRHEDPINMNNFVAASSSLEGTNGTPRTQSDKVVRQDMPPAAQEPNRVREAGYPYRPNNAQQYLHLKLKRRPMIDCLKAVLVDPVQNTMVDLYSWRMEFPGFDSKLQFFPTLNGGMGNYPALANGLTGVRYPFANFPKAIYVDYRTGYLNAKDVPIELRSVVMWLASIPFLNDLGKGLSPNLSSASVNLNSISESFTTSSSATSATFGAETIIIQKQLKEWYTRNAQKYRRDTIGVL